MSTKSITGPHLEDPFQLYRIETVYTNSLNRKHKDISISFLGANDIL
jgi:hypothetical protein